MNLLIRLPVLAAVGALITGCATEQKRQEQAVARVESAADEFKASRHRYPRSVTELQAFLTSRKPPEALDLEPLLEVKIQPSKDDTFGMFYKRKGAPPEEIGVLIASTPAVSSGCGSLGQGARRSDK